mgnify:CR=1 FL=1
MLYLKRKQFNRGDDMNVQCILCDNVEHIEDDSQYANELKNNYLILHLCDQCNERIAKKTLERLNTGKFRTFKERKKDKYL